LSVRSWVADASGRVSSPRFSLCLACPKRPLCSGDGLGAPDTVLGRAGRKGPLGRAAGNEILSDVPQTSLGAALGDAAGDALTVWCTPKATIPKGLYAIHPFPKSHPHSAKFSSSLPLRHRSTSSSWMPRHDKHTRAAASLPPSIYHSSFVLHRSTSLLTPRHTGEADLLDKDEIDRNICVFFTSGWLL
jgi:hypothetical protein